MLLHNCKKYDLTVFNYYTAYIDLSIYISIHFSIYDFFRYISIYLSYPPIFFLYARFNLKPLDLFLCFNKKFLGKFNEWTHLPLTKSNQSITFFKLIVLETNRPNTRINPWCLVNCLYKNFNYFFFSFYLLSSFASVLLIFFRNIYRD